MAFGECTVTGHDDGGIWRDVTVKNLMIICSFASNHLLTRDRLRATIIAMVLPNHNSLCYYLLDGANSLRNEMYWQKGRGFLPNSAWLPMFMFRN